MLDSVFQEKYALTLCTLVKCCLASQCGLTQRHRCIAASLALATSLESDGSCGKGNVDLHRVLYLFLGMSCSTQTRVLVRDDLTRQCTQMGTVHVDHDFELFSVFTGVNNHSAVCMSQGSCMILIHSHCQLVIAVSQL